MSTIISRVFYTGRSGANWADSGPPYPPDGMSWTDDQNDATYMRHGNGAPSLPNRIDGTIPAHTAPTGQQLHRVRLSSRARCHSGSTTIDAQPTVVWPSVYTYQPASGPSALGTSFVQHDWPWETPSDTALTGGTSYFTLEAVGAKPKFDVAELWVEFDYRVKPAFTVAATAGITRAATITATGISLDGLPARDWTLSMSGPDNWSTSGTGAFPGSVTTPDLANGTYTATLTISSTIRGADPYSTTKTATVTIDYRNRPAFTLNASAGITRKATVSAAPISLDGLPARDWTLTITGPTPWTTSGTGAFPGSVTTPDLANGSYTVSVTINATHAGGAYGTTKTTTFAVDYRNPPAFTLTASAGAGRYATVTASSINLDGLPARSWTLAITGPMTWGASGSGGFPPLGVTTSELANGTYTVTVTINATHGGDAYGTTKTTTFVVASAEPFTLLCDTDFESTLARHFDVACNSMGAIWWCDRNGVVQFAPQPPDASAFTFTDNPATAGIKYTDLRIAYDSRNLVNDLEATNKPLSGEVHYRHHEPTSVAMWGSRTDSVDLTVYDVGGALAQRVRALVGKFATLAMIPAWLTFLAKDYPAAAGGLDLYQRVTVEYDGEMFSCLVVGIDHKLSPTTWTITVHLMKA